MEEKKNNSITNTTACTQQSPAIFHVKVKQHTWADGSLKTETYVH